MPVNRHLRYFDLTDFTAGRFADPGSGNQLLMPTGGAQTMDDCYPQAIGGLRAFFTSTAISTSGLDDSAHETCTGIFLVSGYSRRTGAPGETGNVRYMTTWNTNDNKARIYRMDGTIGATTWTKLFTGVATADNAADRRYSSFVHFMTTGARDYVVLALRSGLEASDRGLYTIEYVPGATSGTGLDGQVTYISGHDGPLAIAQGRIVVGENEVAAGPETIYWSDIGAVTFGGATSGSLTPSPSYPLNGVVLIAVFDPDQLLLGFQGAPWVTISGDINSPTTPVRQMGDGHFPYTLQDPIRTPDGVVFMEKNGSAYLTDGRVFTDLTAQLPPFTSAFFGDGIDGLGTGAFLEGFLFLPGGNVRFEESRGWFHVSEQSWALCAADPRVGVLTATKGIGFTLRERDVSRGTGTRASSYTWRSAPFAQPDGTQSEVREVVIQTECYGTSSFAVTLTDHLGNNRLASVTGIATGKHAISVPTLLRGDYMDVKIVATGSGVEAPTIERVRVGFGMGHSL